jgi:predicted signal transduction protein with EAL and GGDEF domain
MAHAKGAGGNTYRFFYAELDARMQGHLALEAELRRALVGDRGLTVHYQPKIALVGRDQREREARRNADDDDDDEDLDEREGALFAAIATAA